MREVIQKNIVNCITCVQGYTLKRYWSFVAFTMAIYPLFFISNLMLVFNEVRREIQNTSWSLGVSRKEYEDIRNRYRRLYPCQK